MSVPRAAIVAGAADKWHVPRPILLGVWGKETSFGTNVSTSSAGAIGDFQFLPSTAVGKYAGGTAGGNSPSDAQFAMQADAAAHYLHDLFAAHGSWDAALRAYSGGGYGQADVLAMAKNAPGVAPGSVISIPNIPKAINSAANSIGQVGASIGNVLSFIFSIQFLYIVAGFPLVLMGAFLVYKAGGGPTPKGVPIPV